MSRTWKDRPWKVQQRVLPAWTEKTFPPPVGGAWRRIGRFANLHERSFRRATRDALKQGAKPMPSYRRDSAKWDVW